jgi:hypothetical protein
MTTFRVATEADDAVLRGMLRDNGMPTWVEMTIEREPSFFAGKNFAGEEWAVIAEDEGDVVGMYTASILPVHVDGRPARLGYLGGLRVNPQYRRNIRFLREGYASIRAAVPWWFTIIATENTAARRLLEAGIPGLPAYHPLGDYVTFAIPTVRGKRRGIWRRADDVAQVVAVHNEQASRFQCSPVLDEELVRRIGIENFYVCDAGVAALWDQRAFKQIVARRYRRPSLIPLYNAYAKLFRRIPLPRQGGALDQTFVAYLALTEFSEEIVQDLLSHCTTPVASVGLHAAHPLIPILERFKPISYPARVYAVTFNGQPPRSERPVQPEAALL